MTITEKFCNKCSSIKDISCFSKRGNGYQPWCKECSAAHNKQWNATNQDTIAPRRKINARKNRYGLTEDAYQLLLKEQNYLCACCKLAEPAHVDHDHSCCPGVKTCGNCVRGLLCVSCNTFIGRIEANPQLYIQVMHYLHTSK